jgi:glutaredoxin
MGVRSLIAATLVCSSAVAPRWDPRSREAPKGERTAFALETLRQTIQENTVVIFSRAECKTSQRVKTYFEDEGIPYYALELDQRSDGDLLKTALAERTGSSKTPSIFIRGQLVGGAKLIKSAFDSGELKHWTEDEPSNDEPPGDHVLDA